jgi:hypothetical protein
MHDTGLDDDLRSLLEQERTSIPDDGFCQSVMRALPKRRAFQWHREIIVPGMTLVGCFLGLILFPGGNVLRDLLLRLPNAQFVRELPVPWLVLVYLLSWAVVTSMLERRAPCAHIENFNANT